MSENSKIQWATHTFNPWIGCAKVSDGCKNCYAEALMDKRYHKAKWGPHGTRNVTSAANWSQVRKWNRAAREAGERHRVFCASLADVFEDREDLEQPRKDLFSLIYECPALDWLVLTKRPQIAFDFIGGTSGAGLSAWPELYPHVWLGTSVENQTTADERIPWLLKIPASVRFLSCEPLLGPINLQHVAYCEGTVLTFAHAIDWVIVGGESGKGSRPFNVQWARDLREQCLAAGVPFFMKQFGSKPFDPDWYGDGTASGSAMELNDPKGGDMTEWPTELRVREFPQLVAN